MAIQEVEGKSGGYRYFLLLAPPPSVFGRFLLSFSTFTQKKTVKIIFCDVISNNNNYPQPPHKENQYISNDYKIRMVNGDLIDFSFIRV
jgi:hypothetical protein